MTTLCRAIFANFILFTASGLYSAEEITFQNGKPRRGDIEVIGATSSSGDTSDTLKEAIGQYQLRGTFHTNVRGENNNYFQRIVSDQDLALPINNVDNNYKEISGGSESGNYHSSESDNVSAGYNLSSSHSGYHYLRGSESFSSSQSGSSSSNSKLNLNFTNNPSSFGQSAMFSSKHSQSFSSSQSRSNSTFQSGTFMLNKRTDSSNSQAGEDSVSDFYNPTEQILLQNYRDQIDNDHLNQTVSNYDGLNTKTDLYSLEQQDKHASGNSDAANSTRENFSSTSIEHLKESNVHNQSQTANSSENYELPVNQLAIHLTSDSEIIQESTNEPWQDVNQASIEHMREYNINTNNNQTEDPTNINSQTLASNINQLPIKYFEESSGNSESTGKTFHSEQLTESSTHDSSQINQRLSLDTPINHQFSWQQVNQFSIQKPLDTLDIRDRTDETLDDISHDSIEHIRDYNNSSSLITDINTNPQTSSQEINQIPIKYLVESLPRTLNSSSKTWDNITETVYEKSGTYSFHDNSQNNQHSTADASVNHQLSWQQFPTQLSEDSLDIQESTDTPWKDNNKGSIEQILISEYNNNNNSQLKNQTENFQISSLQINQFPNKNVQDSAIRNSANAGETWDSVIGTSENTRESSLRSNSQYSDTDISSQSSWQHVNLFNNPILQQSLPDSQEIINKALGVTSRINNEQMTETNIVSKTSGTYETIQSPFQQDDQFPIGNLPLLSGGEENQSTATDQNIQSTGQRVEHFHIASLNRNENHSKANKNNSVYYTNNNDQLSMEGELELGDAQFSIEHVTLSIKDMHTSTEDIFTLNSSVSLDQPILSEQQHTDEIRIININSGTSDGSSEYSGISDNTNLTWNEKKLFK